MKYRSEIDGLRGIAVLAVIFYHLLPEKISGGYIGVDIFFVISGYVITCNLLESLANDNFSFIEFYRKRVLRLFPALITVLLTTLIFGWLVLFETEYAQLGKHTLSSVAFIQNFTLAQEIGYFDNSSNTKPLLHLWSLSVEEQFYLLWPLLIYFSWKKNLKLSLVTLCLLLISYFFNIAYVDSNSVEVFYWSAGRFWEILSGSMLSVLQFKKNKVVDTGIKGFQFFLPTRYLEILYFDKSHDQLKRFSSVFGITLIVYGVIFLNDELNVPGNWSFVPVIGTLMVIYSGSRSIFNRVLLKNKTIVWVGLISYPLYLWHYPILSFLHILDVEVNFLVGGLAIFFSLIFAWLTYYFIENPIRKTRYKEKISTYLIVSLAIVGSAGYIINYNDGFNFRTKSFVKITDAFEDWSYPGKLKWVQNNGISYVSNSSQQPSVILLGDSHIEQYGPRISTLTSHYRARPVAFLTGGGCLPMPNIIYGKGYDHCYDLIKNLKILLEGDSVEHLVIGACFNCYLIPNNGRRFIVENGQNVSLTSKEGVKLAQKLLFNFAETLSTEYKVSILLDSPRDKRFNPKLLLSGSGIAGRSIFINNFSIPKARIFDLSPSLIELEAEMKLTYENGNGNIQLLSQSEIICPGRICNALSEDGRPIYKDGDHMRPWFVKGRMHVLDQIIIE